MVLEPSNDGISLDIDQLLNLTSILWTKESLITSKVVFKKYMWAEYNQKFSKGSVIFKHKYLWGRVFYLGRTCFEVPERGQWHWNLYNTTCREFFKRFNKHKGWNLLIPQTWPTRHKTNQTWIGEITRRQKTKTSLVGQILTWHERNTNYRGRTGLTEGWGLCGHKPPWVLVAKVQYFIILKKWRISYFTEILWLCL